MPSLCLSHIVAHSALSICFQQLKDGAQYTALCVCVCMCVGGCDLVTLSKPSRVQTKRPARLLGNIFTPPPGFGPGLHLQHCLITWFSPCCPPSDCCSLFWGGFYVFLLCFCLTHCGTAVALCHCLTSDTCSDLDNCCRLPTQSEASEVLRLSFRFFSLSFL